MEANELRIGNWYKHPMAFEPSQITDTDFISSFIDKFEPIPLTEEWLLKMGFEADGYDGDYGKAYKVSGIWSCVDLQMWSNKEIHFVTNSGCTVAKLEHVNQLQNLYFALTGEELQIKE